MMFDLRPNPGLCFLQKPLNDYHQISPIITSRAPPLDCWLQTLDCLPAEASARAGGLPAAP
jgi:hypothetical protein